MPQEDLFVDVNVGVRQGLMRPALPVLPDAISLPDGVTPVAVTFAEGWIAIVTEGDRLLVYSVDGDLLGEISLSAP